MLTFLALASNKGFVVDSYEHHAVGFVDRFSFRYACDPLRREVFMVHAMAPFLADGM
jgi:hypothetical protein